MALTHWNIRLLSQSYHVGYPLCADLPAQSFLKKGASYRFLGSSNIPELMADPPEFATDDSVIKLLLDNDSSLKELLCNEDGSGDCQYPASITLSSDLSCTGDECEVDTLRVVQVAEGIYYEYVQVPCVELAFYKNAKKISPRYSWDPVSHTIGTDMKCTCLSHSVFP